MASEAATLRPAGAAGQLFDRLLQARCEVLGARWLPGIALNLQLQDGAQAHFDRCLRSIAGAAPAVAPGDELEVAAARLAELVDDEAGLAGFARELCLALHARDCKAPPVVPGDDMLSPEPSAMAPGAAEAGSTAPPRAGSQRLGDELAKAGAYRVFTRRYDEVRRARELVDAGELQGLRAELDAAMPQQRRWIALLARRLQGLLWSKRHERWQFEQDAGLVDNARLHRLLVAPDDRHVFRRWQEQRSRNAAVSLLLDNSGSMRGRPMLIAALVADVLARALESCGIAVEVLGFTTVDWDGGAAARDWRRAGAPSTPGRLVPLRHIVYKSMDQTWRAARRDLAVMLKPDLLRENVDGEAVAWAAQRLASRDESRKLLVVISDGAPMDRATVAANGERYLEAHLGSVLRWVQQRRQIELRAIGIGYPVNRFYPAAINLRRIEDLGETLVDQLESWLLR